MADDNKINKILGSNNKIAEKYLELGAKYFNITPDTAKQGLFGYVNEIAAHSTKEGVFHRNMMYNEYFFNTASLPSSIYNFATNYNVTVNNALPSKAGIVIGFNVNEIKKLSTPEEDNSTVGIFRLDRNETKFIVGDFIFMLPLQIIIRLEGNNLVAQYDTQDTPIIDRLTQDYMNNPFIVTYQDQINVADRQDLYVFLRLDIFQYTIKEDEIEVRTNNLSDQLYYTIQFQDQLVDFNVFYTEANQNTQVLPKFLNNVQLQDNISKYAFYNFIDSQKYSIFFPVSEKRFRPVFNSKIVTNTYQTKGTAGNFTYTGNVLFTSTDDDQNKLTAVISLVASPAGGRDRPPLAEIKKELFRVIKSNSSLITEDDLNDFFSTVTTQNFSSNSKVKFIKYRDDLIKREFNAFILMTDGNGIPAPTNTVDVYTNINEIELNNQSIPGGQLVVYDSQQNKYRFLRSNEYPEEFMTNNNTFVYAFPYLANITFDPYIRVQFFNNFIDQNIKTLYTSISSGTSKQVNFTQINVTRNPILQKEAVMRCVITSDEIMRGETPTFEVYAIFETNNANKSLNTTIGYTKLNYSPENKDFFLQINVADKFNQVNRMIITNQLKDLNTGLIIEEQAIPEKMNIKFALVEKRVGIVHEKLEDSFDTIRELDSYSPIAYLSIEKPVTLYESVNDIVRQDIFIDSDDTVKITKLPLMGSAAFFNTNQYNSFMKRYIQYVYTLRENFGRLKNNTDVNVKFYNTYGLQNLFDIDRVDLSMDLEVKITNSFQTELDTNIKKFIIDYVLQVNESSDSRLSVSNLIRQIENNFQDISYINFKTINGAPITNITTVLDIQVLQEQSINVTPEILQIGYTRKNPDLGQPDVPNITIKYI